jgi:hypothetical protein
LKPLLPSLISQEHAGFVEGRHIMDNIIHAHELIHTPKLQKRGEMIIQLNLAKAYDKISWNYIVKTLEAFGFTNIGSTTHCYSMEPQPNLSGP